MPLAFRRYEISFFWHTALKFQPPAADTIREESRGSPMHLDNYCRKSDRVDLALSVTICTRDAAGNEHTYQGQVIDASKCGLRIRINCFIRREAILFLTLPFPSRLRAYDFLADLYHTYGVVVHSKRFGPEDFELGVRLLHNNIPAHVEPFVVADHQLMNTNAVLE
jgi:hypothetical protein